MAEEIPSIQEILIAWYTSYGQRIPSSSEEKIRAYMEFIKTCSKYGYSKDDLSTKRKHITTFNIPNSFRDKQTREDWGKSNGLCFDAAMIEYFKVVKLEKLDDIELAALEEFNKRKAEFDKKIEEYKDAKEKELQEAIEKNTVEEPTYTGGIVDVPQLDVDSLNTEETIDDVKDTDFLKEIGWDNE